MRQLELLAESFNLFNHQNVTEVETTGYSIESGTTSSFPTLNFFAGPVTNSTTGAVTKANTTAFGQPLNINATNFYRERQFNSAFACATDKKQAWMGRSTLQSVRRRYQ